MLHKIRKTTDSIIFRVFIGLVAVAFAWSFRDVVGFGDSSLVSFKNVPPIKRSEFEKAKSIEISRLQRSEGMNFTEEQIDEMNIPASVLQKLITTRLIKFLALEFDLDFSDGAVADVIKKLPIFMDEDNVFEMDRFKAYLRANNMSVEEYSGNIHNYLAQTIILGSLVGNAHIPKQRIENIVNYMSERRVIDVATLSLTSEQINPNNVKEDILQNFYNENKDLFKSPWKRDICYLTINQQTAGSHIKVTEEDIRNFYNENKSEFQKKKFERVKDQIQEYLQKEKFDYWITSRAKTLDDEVAAGSSLSEIAAKNKIQMKCEKNITASNIENKASGLFAPFLTDIYDMSEGEVSYPADLESGGLVLFEITKYVPEALLEYAKVKNKVKEKYAIFSHRQEKIKLAQDFVSSTNPANFVADARAKNLQLMLQRPFVRANMTEESIFPNIMLNSIFTANKDVVLGPFIEGDKAYAFVVKSIGNDKKTASSMRNEKNAIVSSIKEGMSEELIQYAGYKSKMNVKVDQAALRVSKASDEHN